MTIQILNFSFNNISVSFREDGYLNATAIAEHFGKRVQHYLNNDRTQEYIAALIEFLSEAEKTASQSDLVIIKKGNSKNFKQGTWLHPKLAVDFARWLNPKFAVWCDEQIEHLLKNGQMPTVQPALPHNPYTFSEEDAQVLDMPLIQYVNKLIGYYCKHKGVSHAVIEKQLVTQFGHGNKDLRLQSKRCHLAAVTWLHEQLDQLPKVNFAVSREDLLHIFRQQCEYKKMFEGWNEDQLQRWLDVTFFSDSPRVLNYPRKLDNASYGQLEKLVGAMKAVLGDSFQLLAQECEPRRELSVSADLLVKVSDKLLKFQEFAECVETMAESLGYFMKDGNWRMVDCQLRCLSSLAYQALNENASTLADDLDGLLTA